MTLLYDARHLTYEFTGLARYSFGLLQAILDDTTLADIKIIFMKKSLSSENSLIREILERTKKMPHITIIYTDQKPFSIKQHWAISKLVNTYKPAAYIYPHFDCPAFVKVPTHIVVHDLFPIIVPHYFTRFRFIKRHIFRLNVALSVLKKNVTIHVNSQSTLNDLSRNFFGHKAHFIGGAPHGLGVDQEKLSIHGKFLFYLGDRRPHKNLKLMLDIFDQLKSKELYKGSFVIAGSKQNFDFDLERYASTIKDVVILGNLRDTEVAFLYNQADALFFLTSYEGYGMPIAEAINVNLKVISSSVGACAEFARPGILLLDPRLAIELQPIDQIAKFLNANAEFPKFRELEHSWEVTWLRMKLLIAQVKR